MRHMGWTLGLALFVVAGCNQGPSDAEVERAIKSVNVIDESNLNDIMLQAADPNEAVAYFRRALGDNPDRIDLKRGLATSLIRAKRVPEGRKAWKAVADDAEATAEDQVAYADALIRDNDWEAAEATLGDVPPTYETYRRYRLEAMVADANKNWTRADSFYETASELTTKPSGVFNNWGYSKLTRGDYREAEKLFVQALTYDGTLFTAKNNLVLARGAQRNYQLPVVDMTQTEQAELIYTMALTAIKQGDVSIGKGLLQDAIDTHPQFFEAAQRSLDALEANVRN